MVISVDGKWFVDDKGRKVILRGVNLGGSSKVPFTNGATHIKIDFSGHRDVSFVNRPFPLDEADEHFKRLKHWGFNCIRLLTTWEAIEHKGPGTHDLEYIDYFVKICESAAKYNFNIFIDPHQDVWSRMTGGDGAPGWTFEKVGIDIRKLSESDAALTMQHHYPKHYPQMTWAMNHYRFGAATMFTLFFGGKDFAPQCKIDGSNVQDYFQTHFIASIAALAKPLVDNENVIGFGPMNEPGAGYIGVRDLNEPWDALIFGKAPTPFETIISASGIPCKVPYFKQKLLGLRESGTAILNPNAVNIWTKNCLWKRENIWEYRDDGKPVLKINDHFAKRNSNDIHFFRDYLKPFSVDFTNKIRSIIPDTIIFLEGQPISGKGLEWGQNDPPKVVNASHWYDIPTLVTKKYRSWVTLDISRKKFVFRSKNVRKVFLNQLKSGLKNSEKIHDGIPSLLGEFGLPYDLHGKKAYRTGNYKKHVQALSLYYDLLDELMLNSTQWNYTSDNSNQWGDLWNLEDLSVFSRDQQNDPSDINSGGRAIEGFCRPYPIRITGEPLSFEFDQKKGVFHFDYINNPSIRSKTVIFVPNIQFSNGFDYSITSGVVSHKDQLITVDSTFDGKVSLQIIRK